MNIEDFINRMIYFFPNIKRNIEKHNNEYGEALNTILIEEIIMPEVIELLKKDENEEKLKEIFDFFENVCINSEEYLKNVFSITVLEILGNDKTILEKAKKYMGSITTKLQRKADIAIGRQV